MKLIRGDKLNRELRKQVLARYCNRHLDHTWKTDDEWLFKHAFYVTKHNLLSEKHQHCEPGFMSGDYSTAVAGPYWDHNQDMFP